MLLKLFIFLLPVVLFSAEVVWDGDAGVSKEEYDKAIKEYVELKYPAEVNAWKNHTVSLDGLMWQDNKDTLTVQKDWDGAMKYCKDLELVGFTDWRLPTKDELFSILDKARTPIIKKDFEYTATDDYWSASPHSSNINYVWYVSFHYGFQSSSSKESNHYVRCVRGG